MEKNNEIMEVKVNETEKIAIKYKKTIEKMHQSYGARIEQKSEALLHFKKKSKQL